MACLADQELKVMNSGLTCEAKIWVTNLMHTACISGHREQIVRDLINNKKWEPTYSETLQQVQTTGSVMGERVELPIALGSQNGRQNG